ncbi:hypothetical protein [Maribacter sp. 2307ULW6-5]|uniref:hypothetical protein n=1 Tax=Maribacter sp. 2307ULW6-5 TaxID=3386275 RepID=UPI0039BC4772
MAIPQTTTGETLSPVDHSFSLDFLEPTENLPETPLGDDAATPVKGPGTLVDKKELRGLPVISHILDPPPRHHAPLI